MDIRYRITIALVAWLSLAGVAHDQSGVRRTIAAAEDLLHREKGFANFFDTEVLPLLEGKGVRGTFTGKNGVPIRYLKLENDHERGAIVISNGKGESYLRYRELLFDLYQRGYSVYIMDHRGQGLSGRVSKADPTRVDVERFENYVEDFKTFVDKVVKEKDHPNTYLLCHSTGGLIGTLYLEKHPGDFQAAALLSPLFEVNTGKYSERTAKLLTWLRIHLGKGLADAQGRKVGDVRIAKFEDNITTHSEARYARKVQDLKENPQTLMGGTSNRWVHDAIVTAQHARQMDPSKITIPLLMLQAGKDTVVRLGGQDAFCRNFPQCKKVTYPDAYHELYVEKDPIRAAALAEVLRFFAEN